MVCCCGYIAPRSLCAQIITPWSLAQNTTFFEQLAGGVRYVDLRSCWNGSEWRTFHFELGNTVQGARDRAS